MSAGPPRFARAILARAARSADRHAIVHDADAEFEALLSEGATVSDARRWYRRQVRTSLLPLLRSRIATEGVAGTRASWLDVRLGLRRLRKYPGLTLVAVLSLGVGIPVGLGPMHAAGIFEATLPVPEGDRVHVLKRFDPASGDWARSTVADYAAWAEGLERFTSIAAVLRSTWNLDTEDFRDPAVAGAAMSGSAFEALRVVPALGRILTASDESVGSEDVVLLGHDVWRSRFAADPAVVGSAVRLGGVPHTVVGVMPEGFRFPYREQLWVPLRSADPATDARSVLVFGRLADGADVAEARTEFGRLETRSGDTRPDRAATREARFVPEVLPFTEGLFGLRPGGLRAEYGFYLVQLLALLVLVVACANISMLLLVRTTARAGELALRSALGARRLRIVTQLVVEALLLALPAAGLGLAIADLVAGRLDFITQELPYWADLGVTWKTVLLALPLAGLSAGIVSVFPALKVTGRPIQRTIQRASAGRRGLRFGGFASGLIVADIALAVVVAGLSVAFTDAATRTVPASRGTVAADEYLAAELRLPPVTTGVGPVDTLLDRWNRAHPVSLELLERLRREPGVRSVAMASALPGMDPGRQRWEIAGRPDLGEGSRAPATNEVQVVPGFFEALGQPLLSGRPFDERDLDPGIPTAIVDLSFVDEVLGGGAAIGHRIRTAARGDEAGGVWREIVGVVGAVGDSGAPTLGGPTVYRPVAPGDLTPVRLAVHLGPQPTGFARRLRVVARGVDPTAIVTGVEPLSDARSFNLAVFGWVVVGVRVLIGVLVALAASGIYALLAFTITERETEIAIRAALGSPRGALLGAIGRRALAQLAIGGTFGTLALAGLFFVLVEDGWTPDFPPLLAALATGLLVVAAIGGLAVLGPVRRGLAIAPDRALRS